MQQPSIPKGTRDFSPADMAKRTFIFSTIKAVFIKYGYLPIETPSMENIATLTGKYGEEGDQLLFKILNSGNFLNNVPGEKFGDYKKLSSDISEKALRYDLTVPFARYVVMHRNEITFPFKRYQIQPVWRADRPQKGRYREFYQCDADVVGSDALINEAELAMIYDEALSDLGLNDFVIKINNRKILSGIAEIIGEAARIIPITIAIDKLDKIGIEGVNKELSEKGISAAAIEKLQPIIKLKGTKEEKIAHLKNILASSEIGRKGIEEMETVFHYLSLASLKKAQIELDITLARGLNYYTGAIFEVKAGGVSIGSIGGGGRYDDLTGIFGLKGVSGVGISFGADRIYDVMEELNLFPANTEVYTKVLITNFDAEAEVAAFRLLLKIRTAGISAEIYPSAVKLKKQMDYANDKKIPFVVLIGSEELKKEFYTLKNMHTGQQQSLSVEALLKEIN